MPYSRIGMLISFIIFTINMLMPVELIAESESSDTSTSIGNVNTDLSGDKTSEVEPSNEVQSNEEPSDEDLSDEYEFCFDDIKEPEEVDKPFFSFLDGTQESISSGVESLARNLDDYFTTNSAFYASSGSYLRVKQNIIFSEGGIIDYRTDVNFKLRLPNTEKKFKLFFETPSIKKPYDNSTQSEKVPATVVTEGNYVLGIQAESGERFGWKYKPTLGIDIDNKIDPFARFRFSRESQYEKWSYKWHETPYWYNSSGWGFDSYFELNRKIATDSLFRAATFAGWRQDTEYFDLSHVFSMFHIINKKTVMSYFTGVYGISEPAINTTHFLFGLTYRQNIHKDYLFMEIVPQILYQKINRFHPEHSITFRLEMLFKK